MSREELSQDHGRHARPCGHGDRVFMEGSDVLAHDRLRDLAQVVRKERGVRALHLAVDRVCGKQEALDSGLHRPTDDVPSVQRAMYNCYLAEHQVPSLLGFPSAFGYIRQGTAVTGQRAPPRERVRPPPGNISRFTD